MPYNIEEIGSHLQLARERHGLSQRAFAQTAGTTQSRISRIERGDIDLRLSTLVELARNLDLEFMLIPRQHVTAVKAIVAQPPLSPGEKSLRTALTHLQEIVSLLSERFSENAQLTRVKHAVRQLSKLKLQSADLTVIKKATDTFKLIEQSPALIGAAHTPVEDLTRLRNIRAHAISEGLDRARPAYRLEEEDDG
jgi:transcriptional regulator with XRE-family HTH domain